MHVCGQATASKLRTQGWEVDVDASYLEVQQDLGTQILSQSYGLHPSQTHMCTDTETQAAFSMSLWHVHARHVLSCACQVYNNNINDLLRSFDGAACPEHAETNVSAAGLHAQW